MKTMAITDFKAHALQIISEVEERKEPVLVTKRGKPIVEVIPYAAPKPTAGRLADALVFETDILTPLGASMWDAAK